jgi:hypothetical protein
LRGSGVYWPCSRREGSERILLKSRVIPLTIAIIMLTIAALAVASTVWDWYSTSGPYVFSPCPGLTVTSAATTGIWHCPNQPVPGGSITFSEGQVATITGTWATGYGTLGCVPQVGESSCVVPQIASLQNYLYANIGDGTWFVVQWKQGTEAKVIDGERVTINGILKAITYSSNPGTTYPIFHLNNQTGKSDLLQPQPSFEITNAVLE